MAAKKHASQQHNPAALPCFATPQLSCNTQISCCSNITSLYPDAVHCTYGVPLELSKRVPYSRDTVPGTGLSAVMLPAVTSTHNVPPASQPPGATPIHNVPPASQPSGSATPVHNVALGSLPSGSATPVHNAPPASQQSNPTTEYSLWTQEAQPLATPVRVQESDIRDDFCQDFILKHLQELAIAHHEVMFILSQLHFGSYLNKPSYASAAAQFPRPINLDPCYREGDFDVLVIHRHYGILIGELKVVGMNQVDLRQSQGKADLNVAKKVRQAVKQLSKSETVLKHLISDIAPGLSVRKTLFLPFVSTAQLQRVLTADPQLEQEVCHSLGAGSAACAVRLCCCSNQLSDPATYRDVTPSVLSELTTWWHHRMTCTEDTILTDDLYLDIVARFVGPATSVNVHCNTPPRVEVRTVGEAVAELGQRLACLVLTLQQLDLMHRSPPQVFLTGPPGTGKTVMLVLQGLRWMREGRDVSIVSVSPESLATSIMIQHQLQMTLRADPMASSEHGTVRLHQYIFRRESDVDTAVSELLSAVQGDTLCVLMDEADMFSRVRGLQRLVKELTRRIAHLYLWCAGVSHNNIPPELQTEVLTTPLRSAPSVLRMVAPAVDMWTRNIYSYSDRGLPAPGDGPNVVRLSHHGDAHTGQRPLDCVQCGKNVAAELRRLGVGTGGRYVTSSPASLTYRDVFILTADEHLQDDIRDDTGNVTSAANRLVRGLRDESIPVCVLEKHNRAGDVAGWKRRLTDVAVALTDEVVVAHYDSVHGLERPVVVLLAGRMKIWGIHPFYCLHALSRCTTQLVIVDPPPYEGHTDDTDHSKHSTGDENEMTEESQLDATGVAWCRKGFLL